MAPKRKRKSPPLVQTTDTAYDAYKAEFEAVWQLLVEQLVQSRNNSSDKEILSVDLSSLEQTSEALSKDVSRQIRDHVLQSYMLNLMAAPEPDYTLLFDVLDAALSASAAGICSDTLPHSTLELLFDTETVEGAEKIFGYVESRSEQIKAGLEPKKIKALIILRFCNELLRRLSRSTHTVFSGRILMFLADAFPIGDQSAVNLRGSYNTSNVTLLEGPQWTQEEEVEVQVEVQGEVEPKEPLGAEATVAQDTQQKQDMEVDQCEQERPKEEKPTVEEEAKPSSQPKVETKLETRKEIRTIPEPDFYTLFWSLQQLFSNPPNLLKSESIFPFAPQPLEDTGSKSSKTGASSKSKDTDSARYAADKIVARFTAANKHERDLAGNTSVPKSIASAKSSDPAHVKEKYFFPKFLTSRKLLELQIADSFFRRQILVQLLIMFQYLRGFLPGERIKALKVENLNKTLIPQAALEDAETKWLAELSRRIHLELRATPPDGDLFAATVQLVLARDSHWISWKLSSCRDFVKPPLDEQEVSEDARAKKRRLLKPARGQSWAMGNPTLSRLWNAGSGNVHDLSDLQENKPEKDARYLKAEIQDQLAIQEQRKEALTNDGVAPSARQLADDQEWAAAENKKYSLAWRALRAICQEDLALFHKYDRKGDLVQLFQDIDRAKAEAFEAAEKLRASQLEKGKKEGEGAETPTISAKASRQASADASPSDGTPAISEAEQAIQKETATSTEGDAEDVQMADIPVTPAVVPESAASQSGVEAQDSALTEVQQGAEDAEMQ